MASNRKRRVPEVILEELETSGLRWHIESGRRHQKIIVEGKMVGILPTGGGKGAMGVRSEKNVRAQIRRAVKEIKGG